MGQELIAYTIGGSAEKILDIFTSSASRKHPRSSGITDPFSEPCCSLQQFVLYAQ
jgi:hypothetical protein